MFDFMDFDGGMQEPLSPSASSGPYIPEASDCMRCGMCVSTCPTFRLFKVDEETPRRRIRTISKLVVEQQTINVDEQRHLTNCVQCRACEPACPSRMAYGSLFDQAKAILTTEPKGWAKLALWLITAKRWRARLMPLLAIYLKSGLQAPLRKSGLLSKFGLAEAEALLRPPQLSPLSQTYPAKAATRGRVALFTGCIAEHFDRETLLAAIKLLNAIGFEVVIPPDQACCGAIHQHNGLDAAALIETNLQIFNALEVDAVLHTASGCGAMLTEYRSDNTAALERFNLRLDDINQFLLNHWPADLQLQAAPLKVAVHEPCSQRNVLKSTQSVYALLEKIPALSVAPLADNGICCGAGGSYMLTHPDNAERLRELKWQAIDAAQADLIVSSNFGCSVFINALAPKLEHVLSALARQLPD